MSRDLRAVAAVLLCVAAVAVACDRKAVRRAAQPAGPQRGDRVVVERAAASFAEARVVDATPQLLRAQTVLEGQSIELTPGEAYRLPPETATTLQGTLGICGDERGGWFACRVLSRAPLELRIEDDQGSVMTVARERSLEPSGVTKLNLQRYFAQLEQRRSFERAVQQAGAPRQPRGFRLHVGSEVLFSRDRVWSSGRVEQAKHHRVQLRLANGDQYEFDEKAVAPAPPNCGVAARGELALLRPFGPAAAWTAVRVTAVDAPNATVEAPLQAPWAVPLRELCPLAGKS